MGEGDRAGGGSGWPPRPLGKAGPGLGSRPGSGTGHATGAATPVTHVCRVLPASTPALAWDTLKDPALLDSLSLGFEAWVRYIESALVRHIHLPLELDAPFIYRDPQVRLEVGGL